MKESAFIDTIRRRFARFPGQHNRIGQADSEIVPLEKGDFAFSMDEYSSAEDHFYDIAPTVLGYNLTVATMSDVLAAGGIPQFYMHATTLAKSWDEDFIEKFLSGIDVALRESRAYLLGGDTSRGENWKYTGLCFGNAPRKILRSGAKAGDTLYSTGTFGIGNRMGMVLHLLNRQELPANEATISLATPRFANRSQVAARIRQYAHCAIDTSDGLIPTLAILQQNNPSVGFTLHLDAHLYDETSLRLYKDLGLPPEVLAFGTLGEYELVFCVAEEARSHFENDDFLRLGEVTSDPSLALEKDGIVNKVADPLPDPRVMTADEYIAQLLACIDKTMT